MQPDIITKELFEEAREQVRKKKGDSESLSKARLAHFEEGLCVQVMHIGPYAAEPATIECMKEFMQGNGLRDNVGPNGKHHEIYLSDPRKAAPDKMKTVLRHPVRECIGQVTVEQEPFTTEIPRHRVFPLVFSATPSLRGSKSVQPIPDHYTSSERSK